jgi:hypothetical protein
MRPYLEAARAGLVVPRFRRPERPSTVAIDEGRVAHHIKPLIGDLPARDLTRADVQRMTDAIAAGGTAGTYAGRPRGKAVVTGGAGTAARVVELLGGDVQSGDARAAGRDAPRDASVTAREVEHLVALAQIEHAPREVRLAVAALIGQQLLVEVEVVLAEDVGADTHVDSLTR